MNRLLRTLKKVIKDWDLFELFVAVIFFPLSLIYIAFRMLQEW